MIKRVTNRTMEVKRRRDTFAWLRDGFTRACSLAVSLSLVYCFSFIQRCALEKTGGFIPVDECVLWAALISSRLFSSRKKSHFKSA